MHVGVDLLFLVPGRSGGRETHARELLGALRAAAEPDLRLTAFVNRETQAAGRGFWSEAADRTVVLGQVSALSRPRWALGETVQVARAAARAGVDVLHSPANFGPPAGRFARVLTLHDVGFRTHPELLSPVNRLATEALVVPAARRAHRVITVSHASREDIVRRLGVAGERVAVVPNGIAQPGAGDRARGRARLGAPERPVVLSVATDLPHKNVDALVAAVAALDEAERPLLVLAGDGTERRSAAGVRGLGPVSTDELEDLYAAADALATATRYEGFGLPVLEALARGVPVACSDLPVLHEVAGSAAVFFDPRDPQAIAAALRRALARDDEARQRLEEGRRRAGAYTWAAAAAATLRVYEEALAAGGRGPSRPARASR